MILQRHAEAEIDGDDDLSRPLSPIGFSQAAVQGETFRELELYPELIMHSPAMRSRQTAEIMAVKLELSQGYTVEDNDLYLCDSSELMAIIRNLPDDVNSVLIVGHNPAIENVADALEEPITVQIEKLDENTRKITISGGGYENISL